MGCEGNLEKEKARLVAMAALRHLAGPGAQRVAPSVVAAWKTIHPICELFQELRKAFHLHPDLDHICWVGHEDAGRRCHEGGCNTCLERSLL